MLDKDARRLLFYPNCMLRDVADIPPYETFVTPYSDPALQDYATRRELFRDIADRGLLEFRLTRKGIVGIFLRSTRSKSGFAWCSTVRLSMQ